MDPAKITMADTELETWFERDRAHVALYLKSDTSRSDPLLDLWDDAVVQAFEDGFLTRDFRSDDILHASAFDYARELGMLDPKNRVKPDTVPLGTAIVHEDLGVFMGWKAGPVYLWSTEVDEGVLAKGAFVFANEEDASDFMKPEDEDDKTNEYVGKLSFHEVVLDVAVEHSARRRASVDQVVKVSNFESEPGLKVG